MVFEFDSAPRFLEQEFRRRMRLNSRYSLRAFARDLQISSGALSEIMHQQRPLSLKTAAKIARRLGFNEAESKRLYELVSSDQQKNLGQTTPPSESSSLRQRQLDEDTFQVVSDWSHFAILNLMDCEDFRWSTSHIAKRLGLGLAQAQLAMDLLMRLGLVRKKGTQVVAAQDAVLATTNVPSSAFRQYHRQLLEKASQALELQNLQERDITGVGFAVDPERLPQIKREISDFQDQLTTKYSRGKRHEVYFLEMALFRLTQGGRDEKK